MFFIRKKIIFGEILTLFGGVKNLHDRSDREKNVDNGVLNDSGSSLFGSFPQRMGNLFKKWGIPPFSGGSNPSMGLCPKNGPI